MTTKNEMLKRMAQLESINDQLMTELTYVDQLMRLVGFSDGLNTVKQTAQEMMTQPEKEIDNTDEGFDKGFNEEGLETI